MAPAPASRAARGCGPRSRERGAAGEEPDFRAAEGDAAA